MEKNDYSAKVMPINKVIHPIKYDFVPLTLHEQEQALKDVWKAYSNQVDRFGETKQTNYLREHYFNLLRIYRKNKKWHEELKSS